MKVIIELMKAYSNYVELPLLLVNLDGEIDYKVEKGNYLIPADESAGNLKELTSISVKLTKPTIMSVPNERYESSIFYIITPTFDVSGAQYYFGAGPFFVEQINANNKELLQKQPLLTAFSEGEIEDKISKMLNLHQLLKHKEKVETQFMLPEKMMEILWMLTDLDCEILDFKEYIIEFLKELFKLKAFDFLGIALKNNGNVFVIKHICGERVQHLIDKQFYMGEGLLGKAAILGEDFYWSKGIDSQRAEFFNRHGIFSNHLFGFTLKNEKEVDGIIFGGSFKDAIISEKLLKLIECVVRFISQRKHINTKLMDSYFIQSIFANWLDLMDVTMDTKDCKHISYKVLDFCQTLNNGNFACCSTSDDDFIYRGKMKNDWLKVHQNVLANAVSYQSTKLWSEGQCIHFYLDDHSQYYGLFTIGFDETANLQQAAYILGMVNKLLKYKEGAGVSNIAPASEPIFEVLHTSMREMNQNEYQLSVIAMSVLQQLGHSLQIRGANKERLLNICKVLPYSFDFLKKQIGHTQEWRTLQEMQKLLQHKSNAEEFTIETEIIAYIYQVIISKEKNDGVDFLSDKVKEICTMAYEASLKIMEHRNESNQVKNDYKDIEDLIDLKSVISSLALTSREQEILYLILEGLNNQEVGKYLTISVHTVKNHVTNIFKKLNVSDRIQAMAKIYRIKYEDG